MCKEKISNVIKEIKPDWDIINFGRCFDLCDQSVRVGDNTVKSHPLCRHAYAV